MLALLAVRVSLAQTPGYSVTRLGFVPTAINASGAVAGYGSFADSQGGDQIHAVLYANGQTIDLGTLPGGDHSEAAGINATGQVVGDSTLSGGLTHAFLYSGGQMTDLGVLPGGGTSYATGINDSGAIVGWSDTLQPGTDYPRPDHAFLYSGGQMTDLGNISATGQFVNFSHALAINNAGQVTGWSIADNFETHAFSYTGGPMADLGTLGGSESRGYAIDGAGRIVGYSERADLYQHAFLYSGGMSDLGTLAGTTGSYAVSINDSEAIVGTLIGGDAQSFLYTAATGFIDMATLVNDPNISLSSAVGINNAGQIAITGSDFAATVEVDGFILTPSTAPPVQLLNISTRGQVLSGDNVLIGGFIIQGPQSKQVIVRGIGPSLTALGIVGALPDPILQLFSGSTMIAENDDWRADQAAVEATGVAPTNDAESAIVRTLAPGAYTAVVLGKNVPGGATGVALVDVYDLTPAGSTLANISTRGFVGTGDKVMIGGVIAGGTGVAPTNVIVRAIGPSLTPLGVTGALSDPVLQLYDTNGNLTNSNDDWQSDPGAAQVQAAGIAPSDPRESAIFTTITGGGRTAVVSGKDGLTGVGLVEVYYVP